MTTHPQTEPTAIVTAHTIRLLVTGQPDVKNKFGTGHIRPDNVRLNYRGTHIDARVSGAWVREDGELTEAPIDQPYATDRGDMAGWPDWLAGLATAARGMVATAAVPSVPATQAADVDRRNRYAQAICEATGERWPAQAFWTEADAVLAVADAEMDQLRRERDLAIAHDRQPYPTAWAYEQACKALRRKTEAIGRVRAVLETEAVVGRSALEYRGLIVAALMADDPAVVPAAVEEQPDTNTPCGPVPEACDPEAGEPCANHEREQAHAEGEHCFCGPECAPAAVAQPGKET